MLPKGYRGPAFVLGDGRAVFCYAAPENPDSFGPCVLTVNGRERLMLERLPFRGDPEAAAADLIFFGEALELERIQ